MTRDRARKFERIQINELIKTEDRFRYLLHKSYLSKNLPKKKERHPLPFSKTLTGVLSLFHVAMKMSGFSIHHNRVHKVQYDGALHIRIGISILRAWPNQ